MLNIQRSITAAVFCCGLSGCISPAIQTETVQLTAITSLDINLNKADQASPIVIKVYALKNEDGFKDNNSFFQLYNASVPNADNNDILAIRTLVLLPGKKNEFLMEVPVGTRFMGAIAAYHDLSNTTWLSTASAQSKLTLIVHQKNITFKGD